MIYRMEEPKVVILVFRSGKLVLTGGKTEDQIHEATEKIISLLIENELIY
jgi:transcription initiation factor TFIID TATA-box-binding protein